ncbi:MAG: ARMT1-like domain-containing protein [Oscillospiraceae bacterium]|nr:ARMT1-like domain-containing protein [Oscillospiraceae bacterium]
MKVNEKCAACLWDKQSRRSDDPGYLAEVREIIDSRRENDAAPYLVYLFRQAYQRRFGDPDPFAEIKREYNDLVLTLEDEIREKIRSAPDPLAAALAYARAGNYIDFGAMNHVSGEKLLSLLDDAQLCERDLPAYRAFAAQCAKAERFLLIADNCGEIVLDKLLLEQLHTAFPQMELTVLVRGEEVLNDATAEDAAYVGMEEVARIITNGTAVAGTVYEMLNDAARETLDRADVILAKGQGNFETLSGEGRHVFYAFLCKCEMFTTRFAVPELTGILVEEGAD